MGRRKRRKMTNTFNKTKYRRRKGADQPISAVSNSLEYRLHIRRRTGYHLEDLGGGGLALKRLFGLFQQPRVFDGDDRLTGETGDQIDLPVAERPDLLAID